MFGLFKKKDPKAEMTADDPVSMAFASQIILGTGIGIYEKCKPVKQSINLIARQLASVPFVVVNANYEKQPNHPSLEVFKQINRVALFRKLAVAYEVSGNGFLGFRRRGEFAWDLQYLPDEAVNFSTTGKSLTASGHLNGTATSERYLTNSVLHFRNFGDENRYKAPSPLVVLKAEAEAYIGLTEFIKAHFESGGLDKGIVSAKVSKEDGEGVAIPPSKVKETLNAIQDRIKALASNTTTKAAVIPNGMEWQSLAKSLRDQDLVAVRAQLERDVYKFFGIPPAIFGANLEKAEKGEARQALLANCLEPRFTAFEAEMTKKLLSKGEKASGFRIVFERNKAVLDTYTNRTERVGKGVQMGVITQNEARAELGLPPLAGGDKLYQPAGTGEKVNEAKGRTL